MLAYDEVGTGRTLVFLHGAFSNRRVFGYQLLSLQKHARVVAVDLPGYGSSPMRGREPWLEEAVAGVRQVLQEIGGSSPVVVGWSLGGLVAAAIAAGSPDVTPVFVGTSREPLSPEAAEATGKRLRKDFPRLARTLVRSFTSAPVSADTEEWLFALALESGVEAHHRSLTSTPVDVTTLPLAGAVSIHGAQDRVVPLEHRVQTGRQITFESSGHMPFLEERRRFDQAIVDVLDV